MFIPSNNLLTLQLSTNLKCLSCVSLVLVDIVQCFLCAPFMFCQEMEYSRMKERGVKESSWLVHGGLFSRIKLWIILRMILTVDRFRVNFLIIIYLFQHSTSVLIRTYSRSC